MLSVSLALTRLYAAGSRGTHAEGMDMDSPGWSESATLGDAVPPPGFRPVGAEAKFDAWDPGVTLRSTPGYRRRPRWGRGGGFAWNPCRRHGRGQPRVRRSVTPGLSTLSPDGAAAVGSRGTHAEGMDVDSPGWSEAQPWVMPCRLRDSAPLGRRRNLMRGIPGLRFAPPRAIDVGPDGAAAAVRVEPMPTAWTWTAQGGAKRNPG